MFHSRLVKSSTIIVQATAVLAASVFIGGCGSSDDMDYNSAPPQAPVSKSRVPASGEAIRDPLAFDQLALKSPIKRVPGKGGVVYLEFTYADQNGNMSKTRMPEGMTKTPMMPNLWVQTFDRYRVQGVSGGKKTDAQPKEHVGDFPFISPKPRAVEQPKQPKPEEPVSEDPMPQLPSLPSLPNNPSGR